MSILSSTRSGFYSRLTKAYLLSHGYVQIKDSAFSDKCFYRHRLYSKHCIKTLDHNSELVFYVYFIGSYNNSEHVHIVYITTLTALKELEQMWDETNTKKKAKLKRKLLEKYNKIQ